VSLAALVTGTNRGTGLAIATRLHAEGAELSCLNRRPDGPDWMNVKQCDLADPADIRTACAETLAQFGGRLDLCVLNAARRVVRPIGDLTDTEWEMQLAVNLSSPFRIVRHMLPALKAAGGTIVFMGSHAAAYHFEGGAGYCATKAGLHALAGVLSLEARAEGVRTILVSPGAISNRDYDDSPHKITPEDVADIVWKLSTAGESLVVGEIDIRPRRPLRRDVSGLDRLQIV